MSLTAGYRYGGGRSDGTQAFDEGLEIPAFGVGCVDRIEADCSQTLGCGIAYLSGFLDGQVDRRGAAIQFRSQGCTNDQMRNDIVLILRIQQLSHVIPRNDG
jgi:hypothetical protein